MDVITTHVNADFDAVASMLAAKKLYPDAKLAFPGSQEKGLRDFFLQSTFYVLQTERIKKIDFNAVTRLILVDIRQKDRIGRFIEVAEREGVDIHIYDHHPSSENDLSGSLEVVKEVGATTTILCRILEEKNIEVTPDEATILMMGIYEDTGSLTFTSTTVDDYLAAAFLLKKGASLNVVSDMVTKELTAEQISLLYELIHTATVHTINGTDVVIAKASTDRYVSDFAVLVHKLRDIESINVLFVLAQMEDRIYLVTRSRLEEVDVSKVTAEFGGGGHATAASATIKDLSLDEAEHALLRHIRKHINPTSIARQVMSSPVVAVQADDTIKAVGQQISKFHLNALPVLENGHVVGIVNRPIVDRASSHNLDDLPVREYMVTEFASVTPNTALPKVQKIIVEENQSFLPVVERGALVGVITRTDILRVMQQGELKKPQKIYDFDYDLSKVRKKSLVSHLKERLPENMLKIMRDAGRIADEMGLQVFVVGGFVRDLLLRHRNLDLDLVVEGNGIQFAKKFASVFNYSAKYHRKFGTAQITPADGFKIDVASARREYYESPAALPVVELSSIRQDLYRRDFTVNTLALRLNGDHFGDLIDFFGGRRDIKNRIIKVIHSLSFVEDPTRIFRALRFEQRFGFRISKETENLIRNAVKMEIPLRLSPSRLFSELVLMFQEDNPPAIVERLADFDLLRSFFPQIRYTQSMKQLMNSVNEVTTWFDLLYLIEDWKQWKVYFLGLIDGLRQEEAVAFSDQFTFMKKNSKRLFLELNDAKKAIYQIIQEKSLTHSMLYTLLRPFSIEALLYIMAKITRKSTQKSISYYITHLRFTEIQLTGSDLIKIGLPPGKMYKRVFDSLLMARLDGKISSREDELAYVEKHFLSANRTDGI